MEPIIIIQRLAELDDRYLKQAANVYVDGFYKELSYLSEDRAKLARAFMSSFVKEQFFVALYNDRVVGIAAYSTEWQDAQKLDKRVMRREFGMVRGWLVATALNDMSVKIAKRQCLIENVTTDKEFRGRGIANQLLTYIISLQEYEEYTLEVADTNTRAVKLYEKLGFKVIKKAKQRFFRKRAGYNERWFMQKRIRRSE